MFSYFAVNTSRSGWGQTRLTSRFIVSPSPFPCADPSPHPRPLLALSPSLPEGARAGEEPAAESPCRPPPTPDRDEQRGSGPPPRPSWSPAATWPQHEWPPRPHLETPQAPASEDAPPWSAGLRGRPLPRQAHGAPGGGLACVDAPRTSSATYGQQGRSRWAGALAGPGPPDEARAPPPAAGSCLPGDREHLEPGVRGLANRRRFMPLISL